MRTVLKNVFYCDFCKMRRLSRVAMEKHELHCTMNRERICGWVIEGKRHSFNLGDLILETYMRAPLVSGDIDWLRNEVEGCPACMLAVLRQSRVEYHYDKKNLQHLFDYKQEVERFRKEEIEVEQYAEMRYIEGMFL